MAGGRHGGAGAGGEPVTERAESELKWDKAPCRFCGAVQRLVATKENRVVATHGDIKSGQPRPQLREGLLPLQDHVRP
jgi:nitrate reductase NapA